MTEMNWEKVTADAAKVAREIAQKWCIVEADDVYQEIMLHLVEQADWLAKRQGDETFMRQVYWRAGKAYAGREQNYRDLVDDQYYYTPDEARQVLKTFIYTDDELSGLIGKKDDLTRCTIADNILSARIDAQNGFKKLTPNYQRVLNKVYVEGLSPRDESERKTANRAADALAVAMNSSIRTR